MPNRHTFTAKGTRNVIYRTPRQEVRPIHLPIGYLTLHSAATPLAIPTASRRPTAANADTSRQDMQHAP